MLGIVLGLAPAAVGVALSPAGIVELILVLFSTRARVNGVVFFVTVFVAALALPLIGAFVLDVATKEGTDEPSTAKGWLLLGMGVLLLLVAVRNWRNRSDAAAPKVFGRIANMGPGAVFGLAFGVMLLNPKNLAMLLAAGTQAGASGESTGTVVAALVLFAVLATLPFSLSIGYLFVGGEAARVKLERVKSWLIANNRALMGVLLGVFGAVLIAQGVSAIA